MSSAANRASLDETTKEILAALGLKLDPVVKDVAELKGKYNSIQQNTADQGQDITELRQKLKEMKNNFQSEVMKVVGDKGKATDSSSFKFTFDSIIVQQQHCDTRSESR